LTAAIDCEDTDTVISASVEIAHLVYFLFTLGILGKIDLVIDYIHHVTFFVDRNLCNV
jgi:hypothetical protein